jgi:hypothetical protein
MTRLTWPRLILIGLILLALLAADAYALHKFFTTQYPGANDFFARWRPTRAWLFEGLGPYSEEATLATQIGMYGRPALPDEDKALFSYPFYSILFFVLPALVADYAWASAIWLAVLQFVILGLLGLSLRWARWPPPPWLFGLTLLFGLFWYHTARTLILGQFAALNALLIVGMLLAVRAGRDGWAGILLALAASKPQMTFLLTPVMLLWALTARRWKLVTGFGVTFAFLLGGSLVLRPTWIAEWRQQLSVYVDNSVNRPPVSFIAEWLWPTGQWTLLQTVLGGLLMAYLIWEGWRALKQDGARWERVFALALVTTCLIAPRTATTDYVMMTPVLFLFFGRLQTRWGGRGMALVVLAQLALFFGLWILFAITVEGNQEHSIMYLPWPILMWLGLLWAGHD